MSNNDNHKLLTPQEVSAQLCVDIETLNIWRCTGRYKLPYIKVGRLVRYRKEDIEAFISSRMMGGVYA